MKKLIFTVLVLVALSTTAHAAAVIQLGFRAYSSASSIDCGVMGMGPLLKSDANINSKIQGFSPDTAYSRTYVLGTKGFGHYSTVYGSKTLAAAKFTCRVTGTNTAVPVKLFLNGSETNFLTMDNGLIVIGK